MLKVLQGKREKKGFPQLLNIYDKKACIFLALLLMAAKVQKAITNHPTTFLCHARIYHNQSPPQVFLDYYEYNCRMRAIQFWANFWHKMAHLYCGGYLKLINISMS